MASQVFNNQFGTIVSPWPGFPIIYSLTAGAQVGTIDAAGESFTAVGYVLLSTGPGTSKTISSSGGKIHWVTGAITFTDVGSNLRVGIQDVGATGLEDGSYDVQADLVGGTDTITANVVMSTPMESGTKTITHGDLIAVVIELTARGGTDSVTVRRNNLLSAGAVPYCTADTGAGPAKTAAMPMITIEFDDGTMGWFNMSGFAGLVEASANINSGSTPDEIALVFRLPFPAVTTGGGFSLGSLASTDDFEMILYSDPLGTPVAERTVVQDADLTAAAVAGYFERSWATTHTLSANTDYAIAFRPTTTNNLTYNRVNFNTGNGNLRKTTMLGTNWSMYSRTDQSGAFSSQDTTILPIFWVALGAFDDGAGAGAAALPFVMQLGAQRI